MNKKALLVFLVVFLGLGSILGAGYALMFHRRVDARISLESDPLPSRPSALHHELSFKVAVASMLSPARSYATYVELADRLAHSAGLPLEIVSRDSYAEVNELLRKSEVDLAFVCTGGFASAPDSMEVIASTVIKGKTEFQALIIVPADSDANSFADLSGRSFVFTQPDSLTGHWYPRARVNVLGATLESYFGEVRFTGTHDRSIIAVSQGMAGGGSVSSVIYDTMTSEDETLASKLRVIERSRPYPSPPVVVRKTMPHSLRKRLVNLLVSLDQTPDGRNTLNKLGIDGFVPASNQDYRHMGPGEMP